ncbi:hypothetical protein EJ03DRAFT_190021 [Teratosphaeria nubilosa]|uniref:Uncharacterized protein n=1 Tax=Teratosphaeria nubilosa TaxID=161662 RepID=A0A6G1LIE6_9PEZI|nr:hypothetical protein EJ03DRAFT_190021 [Teratosphaeria nubilosa]
MCCSSTPSASKSAASAAIKVFGHSIPLSMPCRHNQPISMPPMTAATTRIRAKCFRNSPFVLIVVALTLCHQAQAD